MMRSKRVRAPIHFLALGASVLLCAAAFAELELTVDVWLTDPADTDRIESAGFSVTNRVEERVTVNIPESRLGALRALGLPYAVQETRGPDSEKFLGSYHSYAQLTADLQAYAAAHPEICRLTSIGQSLGGKELWVLFISNNPDVEEDEPEFKYISTIHGDEPVGTELCLYLIDRLLNGYGTDPRMTRLVDETAISILPSMNPDGMDAIVRRNNNGVDLNRAFPIYGTHFSAHQFDGGNFSIANREPEVAAVMQWTAENSFVLSANFHTGAEVVNYPYDDDGLPSGTNAPTPDDALMRVLSLRYATPNPRLRSSIFFDDGISNGTAWFRITGGMQDWNYRYTGCIDVTIELSNIKRPASGTLPGFWAENEESMLAYLEAVHLGVRGVVTDRKTGEPVWAKVLVDNNPQPVFTDPDVGDFHRLLLPGTYRIRVDAPDYIPYRATSIVVTNGPATRHDVTLSDGDIDGNGSVNALDVQLVIAAALGQDISPYNGDVDGGGVGATDVQAIINRALGL